MKYFLKELKEQWRPVWYKPSLSGLFYNLRYSLKTYLKVINGEFVGLVGRIKYDANSILCIFALTVITLVICLAIPSVINELTKDITAVIIGLVTLAITAAIFMATISNSALSEASKVNGEFISKLVKRDTVFDAIYDNAKDLLPDERQKLVMAYASELVIDQHTYKKFRRWYMDKIGAFAGTDYEQFMKFPYDVAASVVHSRAWYIIDCIDMYENVLIQHGRVPKEFTKKQKSNLMNLHSITKDHELTGTTNIYMQQPFLDTRLTRVVIVGIIAIIPAYIYRLISGMSFNIFENIDFKSLFILSLFAVFCILVALVLSVRYILLLVQYFRFSSRNAYVHPVSFWYEHPSETAGYYSGFGGHGR